MNDALVLPLESIQGVRPGSVGGPYKLVETGAVNPLPVIEGCFKDTNHGLLK